MAKIPKGQVGNPFEVPGAWSPKSEVKQVVDFEDKVVTDVNDPDYDEEDCFETVDISPDDMEFSPIKVYANISEAYMGALYDIMRYGYTVRRGKVYKGVVPYAFQVRDVSDNTIALPGVDGFHICWVLREQSDRIEGGSQTRGANIAENHGLAYRFEPGWERKIRGNGNFDYTYGDEWGKGGRNQIEWAIRALIEQPTSRQILITQWDYYRDLVSFVKNKFLSTSYSSKEFQRPPCTVFVQFNANRKSKKLNTIACMRANDHDRVMHSDMFQFTETGYYMGQIVGLPQGKYYHWASNLTVGSYGDKLDIFDKLLAYWEKNPINIHSYYQNTKTLDESTIQYNAKFFTPRKDWQLKEESERLMRRGAWMQALERIQDINSQYYKDWAHTMLIGEYMLFLDKTEELREKFGNKAITESQAFIDKNPNFMNIIYSRIKNIFAFHIAKPMTNFYVHHNMIDSLDDMVKRTPEDLVKFIIPAGMHKVKKCIRVEVLSRYKDCLETYNELYVADENRLTDYACSVDPAGDIDEGEE